MAASKNPLGKVVEVPAGFLRLPGATDSRERFHAAPPYVSQAGRTALLHSIPPNNGLGVFAPMIAIALVALIAAMIEDRLLPWRPETTVNE